MGALRVVVLYGTDLDVVQRCRLEGEPGSLSSHVFSGGRWGNVSRGEPGTANLLCHDGRVLLMRMFLAGCAIRFANPRGDAWFTLPYHTICSRTFTWISFAPMLGAAATYNEKLSVTLMCPGRT